MIKMLLTLAAISLPASACLAHELYVSNEKDNTITVIDTKSLEPTRTFKVGRRPRAILFSKDFGVLYVCASDSNAVQAVDPETGELLFELPSGADPEQFALHPDNRLLFIANEDDAIITIVDTKERKVVGQIGV